MKTTFFSEDTILAFHVGRGGRFNNGGYLSFLDYGQGISKYVDDNLFPPMVITDPETGDAEYDTDPDAVWRDCNGNSVGLTNAEYESGIGTIDIDGLYNTTYTTRLKDIDTNEAFALLRDYNFLVYSDLDIELLDALYDYHPDAVVSHLADSKTLGLHEFSRVLSMIPALDYEDMQEIIDGHNWTEMEGNDICRDEYSKIVLLDNNIYRDIDIEDGE